LLISLCLFHSVLVSHRVAGPLFRFKRILADVARGDLSMNIRVRRHDYLRDEAASMDEMVRAMRERVRAIEEAHRRANATLPELLSAIRQGGSADVAVLAARLGAELHLLGAQVHEFRLPGRRGTPAAPAPAPRAQVATLTTVRS
jgi:methyl-accepting chemotaxis protein